MRECFRAADDADEVEALLPPVWRTVVAEQARDLGAWLGQGVPEDPLAALLPPDVPPERPEDPVLARLLPDGYRPDDADTPGANAEFRRLTERDLRARKAADAARVVATADADRLGRDDADAWLRTLNDLRLAIGERLGLREDGDAERLDARLPEGDPRRGLLELSGLLGYAQEELVDALDDLDARRARPAG